MSTIITWDQVNAFRMERNYLKDRAPKRELEMVISSICGIQAQMFPAAQLQIWARVQDIAPEDVIDALWKSKTLLRTWCMRGTAHLITTNDFPCYLEAILKPQVAGHKHWLEKRGIKTFAQVAKKPINPDDFNPIITAIKLALSKGPTTREELADFVESEVGPEARPWVDTGYYLAVKLLAYEGHVCFGPDLAGKSSIVLIKDWIPHQQTIGKENAENTILTKYLHCYGPATPQDFRTWSGLNMTAIKQIWERLSDQLLELKLDGKAIWILSEDFDQLIQASEREKLALRLLPNFDSFLLAHKDKGHIVGRKNYKRVFKKAAWIASIVLMNGAAIGIWQQKRTTKKLKITVEPFHKLTEIQKNAIEAEVQYLANYFTLQSEVQYLSQRS